MLRYSLYASLFFLLTFISACKEDEQPMEPLPSELERFYSVVNEIVVEVAYEPAAPPSFADVTLGNPWVITKGNIEALFANSSKPVTVNIPNSLSDATPIPDQNDNSYTIDEILNLADQFRTIENTDTTGTIFVLFLDGFLEQEGEIRDNVIGVNIVPTTVTAVFKPVINNTSLLGRVRTFTEQSTIVHELGHALGLVNNGVPITSPHHDTNNGAHCLNTDCVMFFQNEGAGNLSAFVQQFIASGDVVLFGDECLLDTNEYMP